MADKYEGISEHKRMAMGGDMLSGDFGVDKLSSHSAGGPAGKEDGGTLPDHKRGAAPPINGNQANPDHGKY